MSKKLDMNSALRGAGYGSRADYAQIARWAASQKFTSTEALLAGVAAKYGTIQFTGMKDSPAPFRAFLPGGMAAGPDGRITTRYKDVMDRYETERDFLFVKEQTEAALDQLTKALRLPVAVSGASMPDVHPGYSLPIGGVVALEGAISPGYVGFDIGCRLHLTLFRPESLDPRLLDSEAERRHSLNAILASSSFGLGVSRAKQADHPVMHNRLWQDIKAVGTLKGLAQEQLGTQGAGNHFCDLVEVEIIAAHPALPPVGTRMVALMSHSGSRGVGNKLGHYYAELAEKEAVAHGYRVDRGHGFLLMDTDAGREYWFIMNLMGEYAQANHDIVHTEFAKNAGLSSAVLACFENHHNFAWLEEGMVVHRKGATPARAGQTGIIPGTSGTSSYLVEGLGNPLSLYSASHGAGRPFSRSAAKAQYDAQTFTSHMEAAGITYYGVAPDETFRAYKNIEEVMAAQSELVRPIARMTPRVVVMGGNVKSDDGD